MFTHLVLFVVGIFFFGLAWHDQPAERSEGQPNKTKQPPLQAMKLIQK